jgi:hypothetical protein
MRIGRRQLTRPTKGSYKEADDSAVAIARHFMYLDVR